MLCFSAAEHAWIHMDTKHEAASTNIWVQSSGPNPNFPTLKFRLLMVVAFISSSRLPPLPPTPLPTYCHHTVLPLHLVHINLSPTNCNHTVHHLTISCQHQLPHSFCVAAWCFLRLGSGCKQNSEPCDACGALSLVWPAWHLLCGDCISCGRSGASDAGVRWVAFLVFW